MCYLEFPGNMIILSEVKGFLFRIPHYTIV